MAFQSYSSRVPPLHDTNFNGGFFDDRSAAMQMNGASNGYMEDTRIPLKKRYTKSHQHEFGGGFSNQYNGGCYDPNVNNGFQSGYNSPASSSSGYSSGEEEYNKGGADDSPLDFSMQSSSRRSSNSSSISDHSVNNGGAAATGGSNNVVRAGVIRHSSKPQMCLAYYYLEK